MNGRATRGIMVVALAVTIAAVSCLILKSGLRLNFTTSMPLGLYRMYPLPTTGLDRGAFVAICAPADAAELGRRRGYLSAGPCPYDTEPLLKAVAGVIGDDIEVSARGIAVNACPLTHSGSLPFDRVGRPLLPWPPGHYHLGRSELWLYAGNDRSWDSRYWGPASVAEVLARAVPLLTVPAAVHSTSGEPRCGATRIDGDGVQLSSGARHEADIEIKLAKSTS